MQTQAAVAPHKNSALQLLRIVASILVVSTHVLMDYRTGEGGVNYGVILADSFTRGCVPVFLMLSGFFMFRGKSFGSVAKSAVLKVALPLLAVCILLQLLSPFLLENRTELGALDAAAIVSAFLRFSADPIANGFYLWYVFVLLVVYFWYPLLRLVCIDEEAVNRTRVYLLALGFLATIATATLYGVVPYLRDRINIPNPLSLYAIFYVVLGYEINRRRSKSGMTNRQGQLAGLLLFALGVGATYALTVFVDIAANQQFDHIFFEYDTIGPMLSAVGLVVLFSHIEIRPGRIQKAIDYLGDRTFGIYLIHWFVILKLSYSGFTYSFKLSRPALFFPAYIALCFVISALLAILGHLIKRGMVGIVSPAGKEMGKEEKPT